MSHICSDPSSGGARLPERGRRATHRPPSSGNPTDAPSRVVSAVGRVRESVGIRRRVYRVWRAMTGRGSTRASASPVPESVRRNSRGIIVLDNPTEEIEEEVGVDLYIRQRIGPAVRESVDEERSAILLPLSVKDVEGGEERTVLPVLNRMAGAIAYYDPTGKVLHESERDRVLGLEEISIAQFVREVRDRYFPSCDIDEVFSKISPSSPRSGRESGPVIVEMIACCRDLVKVSSESDDIWEEAITDKAFLSRPPPAPEPLLALVHGDFTGRRFSPPSRERVTAYMRTFAKEMRREEGGPKISEESLLKLEKALSNTLKVDHLRALYKDNYKLFSRQFIQLLQKEEQIAVAAGYFGYAGGHCVFIIFRLRGGVIEARVMNRGEGSEGARYVGEYGKIRVLPEQPLFRCPVNDLIDHRFWRLLIDVYKPRKEDGTPAHLSITDFYDIVLAAWPGGRGDFSGKDRKPQYGGTCIFSGLKMVVHDLLPEEEARLFLSAFSAHVMHYGWRECSGRFFGEAASHLSRRMLPDGGHDDALTEEVLRVGSRVDTLSPPSVSAPPFPVENAFYDTSSDPIVITLPDTSPDDETIDMPEDLPERLRFCRDRVAQHDLSVAERVALFRETFLTLPPVEDPCWVGARGEELCTLLGALRHGLIETREHIGSDDAALIFVVDSILLRYALSLQEKYADTSTLCGFYVRRIRDVFNASGLDLLRPIHPAIAVKFTEAVTYLKSLKEYGGGRETVPWQSEITISSIHDDDLRVEMPHVAYVRDVMQESDEARKLFTESVDGTDLAAQTMWAWRRLHTAQGEVLRERERRFADLERLDAVWRNFFLMFRCNPGHGISPVRSARRCGCMFSFRDGWDKGRENDGKDLFIESYPGLGTAVNVSPLRWLLSKRQSVRRREEIPEGLYPKFLPEHERAGENAHPLSEQPIVIDGRSLPPEEVEGLLTCTEDKELAIDTIISHFNRFPHSLRAPAMRTALLALLTQTLHRKKQNVLGFCDAESRVCHLLLRAAEEDPEQLLRLIAFAGEGGARAEKYLLSEQVFFFYFLEGLALSYFCRSKGYDEEKKRAYSAFEEKTERLLRDSRYLDETGSLLFALAPYFRGGLAELTGKVRIFLRSDDPEMRIRVAHGYLFHPGRRPEPVDKSELRTVETPPFAGTYRKRQLDKTMWSDRELPIAYAGDLECYLLQSEKRRQYLFFCKGEEKPVYSYDGCVVERLEEGQPTGLFLVRDYASKEARFFGKIADPHDLFLWRDDSGRVVSAEYRNRNLRFTLVGEKWVSSQHPGYYLDDDPVSPFFEPARHYLVLRNEEGRRIVYVPAKPLQKLERPPELFSPPDMRCEEGRSPLFVYRFDEKGEFDAFDARPAELAYALHLTLRAGQFTKAARLIALLKENARPLDRESLLFLLDTVEENREIRDRHPHGVALRIRVALLALDEPRVTSVHRHFVEYDRLKRVLKRDLRDYRMQANNVFPFALTDEEEEMIAKSGVGVCVTPPTREHRSDSHSARLSGSWKRFEMTLSDPKKPLPTAHALRPISLVSRFLDYYGAAREAPAGDPRREEVALLVLTSWNDSVPEVQLAAIILEAALHHPAPLPSAEFLSQLPDKRKEYELRMMWNLICSDPAYAGVWERRERAIRSRGRTGRSILPRTTKSRPPLRPPPAHARLLRCEEPKIDSSPFDNAGTDMTTAPPDVSEDIEVVCDIRNTLEGYSKKGSHEPCVNKELRMLIEGAEEVERRLRKRGEGKEPVIRKEQVSELTEVLEKRIATLRADADRREREIMQLGASFSQKQMEYVRGNIITPLSLNDLLIAFGRKDDERILKGNPFLKPEELRMLKEKIGEYLLAHVAMRRLSQTVRTLAEGDRERAAQLLRAKRAYVVEENPHLLVFEYFTGLMLREEQVAFLRSLSPGSDLSPSLLKEARTGFGKSKVAIPLWLYLTAGSGKLTLLTVPRALLEETRKQMGRILGKAFDQSITLLDVSRRDMGDPVELDSIVRRLERARKEGRVVLLSVGVLHGLSVLCHKELLMKAGDGCGPAHVETVSGYAERIRRLLSEASDFIDESSEALHIGFSYDYSFGRKRPLPAAYIETIAETYELLLSDRDIAQWDEQVYREEILPLLITKSLDLLQVPDAYRGIAKRILGGEYEEALCRPYFDTLSEEELDRFAVVREQLIHTLPASLSLVWNERYVLGEERIAFPARYGTRIGGAQFSSIGLVLNCVFQANLHTPFTREDAERFLEELHALSLQESREMFIRSPGYEALQQFTGEEHPSLNLSREEKEELLRKINADPKHRLRFTAIVVLSKFRYAPQTLTSYPQLIVARTKCCQGASGTLTENMPHMLRLERDVTAPFDNLIPLWRDSQERIRTVSDIGELVLQHGEGHNVIIDTAGYFREFRSEVEIAKGILESTKERREPPIDGVEYVERDTGRRCLLLRGETEPVARELCSIGRERLFTFYGQDATVGVDIDLAEGSQALVTVGRHTCKNFFLQGVGRLRKLRSGMGASFVLSEEDARAIKEVLHVEDLKFKDLFIYLTIKEGERQGEDALDLLEKEWRAEIEHLFREGTKEYPPGKRGELFRALGPIFCEEVFVHPLHRLRSHREECDVREIIDRKIRALLDTLESCIRKCPELREIMDTDTLETRMRGKVREGNMRSRYVGNGGCSRRMAYAEEEADADSKASDDRANDRTDHTSGDRVTFTPVVPVKFPTDELPYTDMSSYTALETHIAEGGLFASPNFLRVAQEKVPVLKGARFVLLIRTRTTDKYEVVLLDLHDANHIKKKMDKEKKAEEETEKEERLNRGCRSCPNRFGIEYVLAKLEEERERERKERSGRDYYLCAADTMHILARRGKPLKQDPMSIPSVRRLMIDARFRTRRPNLDKEDLEIIGESASADAFFAFLSERFVPVLPYFAPYVDRYRKRITSSRRGDTGVGVPEKDGPNPTPPCIVR